MKLRDGEWHGQALRPPVQKQAPRPPSLSAGQRAVVLAAAGGLEPEKRPVLWLRVEAVLRSRGAVANPTDHDVAMAVEKALTGLVHAAA